MKLKFKLSIFFVIVLSAATLAQSLQNILDPGRLPYLKNSKLIQVSSYDTTGGNNDRINIHPDDTAVLADIDGPGVITRIWITIDSRDPYFLRRILLRFYWDGEENPSVEVPVGDFFGTGFEYKQYISQFVGMSSGGYYSYFPMPFNKSARIEAVNETGQEVYAFYYHIDYQKLEEPFEDDVAYFHAQWKRDLRTNTNENYVILDAEGEGHFVGCNMNMQGYNGNLWYLEGDEMVYVDGEKFPSIYGTGTEDYFTSGWYFNRGEFAAPYHGLIIKDDSSARIAVYRFHLGDVIPFDKSLKFTIEHGHANAEVGDYSSVAYWYQKEPHKPFPKMPKGTMRIPLRVAVPEGVTEAEGLNISGAESEIMDMTDYGPDWSGLKQVKVYPDKNEKFSITIPDVLEDKYNVDLYYTTGPDYGNFDIHYQGNKVGEITGYNNQVFPGGKVTLESLKAIDGDIELEFISTGKNEKSVNFSAGIDAFDLEPDREFIADWYIIGPFPNPRNSDTDRKGLDMVFPPEEKFDTTETYIGADSQKVSWRLTSINEESGRMNLWDKVSPYEFVVTYANTYIWSPEDQTVPLMLGSDDGSKVFLNGEELYRFLEVRISEPDQDRIELPLRKGWNRLLIKIENNFGGYAFFARVLDMEDELIINPFKEK